VQGAPVGRDPPAHRRSRDGQEDGEEVRAQAECGIHEADEPEPGARGSRRQQAHSRTEVTKKLWAYIKKNKLQDQKNKRMIKSDDSLKAVFGGKAQVNMFEMTKLVSKHVK